MADRPVHIDGEAEALASAILDAMRGDHPTAFIQGELDDISIDGHFDLTRVVRQSLDALRASPHSSFSAGRKAE